MASIVVLCSCLLLRLALLSSSSTSSSSSSVVELYVLEELPPGSDFGNVAIETGVDRKYSPKVVEMLRFRILFQSPPSAASSSGSSGRAAATGRPLFSVDELTGDVRTVVRIDREEYCRRAGRCTARVDVVIQPTMFFEIVRARIHVLDINDNSPVFPVPLLNHSLPESQSADAAGFLMPEADDPDGPAFGVQRYAVEAIPAMNDADATALPAAEAAIPFEVSYRHGQLRVVPTRVLDRETVDR